tara:strand:- start:15347 stop:15592 length:246 start_codon:yes stop_codon:yes gene_type:complete
MDELNHSEHYHRKVEWSDAEHGTGFMTWKQACEWGKKHPNRVIVRSKNQGKGLCPWQAYLLITNNKPNRANLIILVVIESY